MSKLKGPLTVNLNKNEVLCREGDEDIDLYIIHEGKLLICGLKGSQVTPLAYLEAGEYLGELSFFDQMPRSAYAIAIEETTLIKIPVTELNKQFPKWLVTIARSITKKLRHVDEVISTKGIKRKNVKSIKPLTIKEQTEIYQLIKNK